MRGMTVARCRGEEARRRGRRVGKLGQRGGVVVERGRREGEETAQEGEAQGGEEAEEGEEGEEAGQEGAEGAEARRQARRRVSTMTSGFFSFAGGRRSFFFRTDGGRDAVETSRGGVLSQTEPFPSLTGRTDSAQPTYADRRY